MSLLKQKMAETLSDKVSSILTDKLKNSEVVKFAWGFEIREGEVYLVKNTRKYKDGSVKTEDLNQNIKEFISTAISGAEKEG